MTLVGARDARCGAVLLVEDAGWTGAEVTERLGVYDGWHIPAPPEAQERR